MWTDAARVRKGSAPARGCVMLNGFSPRPSVRGRADARHPVDAAPQTVLQARGELPQDLVAAGVTVRVVDALEEIDVAQDECQGSTVARCAFHLAWEVLAEETPAVDAGQIVGGRQLAVLRQGHPQHALELRDAPCGAETSVELALGRPPCQAVVCAGGEASLALGGVIQLRHVEDEWRAHRGPRPQLAHHLQRVRHHDRKKLAVKTAQTLVLVGEGLVVEHVGGNAPFQLLAHRRVLADEQRARRRHDSQHDRDGRSGLLDAHPRRAPLEDTLYDRGMAAGWHRPSCAHITDTRCKMRGHYMIGAWTRLPLRVTGARSWRPCG